MGKPAATAPPTAARRSAAAHTSAVFALLSQVDVIDRAA